ncbi:MAG: protein translocase subunit SecD, partial [Ignavibacteriales bacterium CG_4_9_14_3_um_filter_34_10]
MKEFRFRIFIILAFVALSVYLLYPTFTDVQNSKKIEKNLADKKVSLKTKGNFSDKEIESKLRLIEDSLIVADPSIKDNREKRVKLGLDLQGGMYLVMEVNTSKLLEKLAKNPDED